MKKKCQELIFEQKFTPSADEPCLQNSTNAVTLLHKTALDERKDVALKTA